jgi:hypothetical protein
LKVVHAHPQVQPYAQPPMQPRLQQQGLPQPHPHVAPRDFTPYAGLPHDRLALIAARRAFVTLKLTFVDAAASAVGPHAPWLRTQVRAAEEPVDLWLLRAPLFAGLAGPEPERRALRQRVRRALEAVFPDPQPTTAFGAP